MFESFESMHMWKISKTIVCSFETIGLRKSVFTKIVSVLIQTWQIHH